MAKISIAGSGTCNASQETFYERVSISGSGTVTGYLNCGSIGIAGSGTIRAETHCTGKISTAGVGKFTELVEADEISTAGVATFLGKAVSRLIHTAGTVGFEDVEAVDFNVAGAMDAKNVSAENMNISGAAMITGLLNAENIKIKLNAKNVINEIGCTNLEVKLDDRLSNGFHIGRIGAISSKNGKGHLECELIEGDTISLINTTAKTVRGKKIVIGENCKIERVEYSESLEIDESSEVKNQIRI